MWDDEILAAMDKEELKRLYNPLEHFDHQEREETFLFFIIFD